jgi:hypothetical protein
MEVENQSNSWLPSAILLLLLIICLAAPRFWQRDAATPYSRYDFSPPVTVGFSDIRANESFLPEPSTDFTNYNNGLGLLTTTTEITVDPYAFNPGRFGQLNIFARENGAAEYGWPSANYPAYESLRFEPASAPDSLSSAIVPSPEIKASLAAIGSGVANHLPTDTLRSLVHRFADRIPAYVAAWRAVRPTITPIENERFASRSQIQIIQPKTHPVSPPTDPFALVPPPAKQSAWCVPQSLLDQLQRLSEHAYTAEWTSRVSYQLRAITEREQLLGDDIQPILADLADAAQQAAAMADNTDDDRLRVELLRAHWALARRLDCWTALHEERVAFNIQGRVAARGDLSPYFDSAPADTVATSEAATLSRRIEEYENTRDPGLGRQLVAHEQILAASPASFDRALADAVEQHYRNANVRVAITAAMVNRWVAGNRSESRPIRERIFGALINGQSDIYSERTVELAPANDEWQMHVQAKGKVESNTVAMKGPVRIRSAGTTDFSGTKRIFVRPDGYHLEPSAIGADSHNQLVGVTTDYDWMPLVGNVARDRARDQYAEKQRWVRALTESRVSSEASESLDRETYESMQRAQQRFHDRFTTRFDKSGVKLTTIEMKSTPERLVARLRIASDDQLGSHTPRPRALSDSLASIQLHETAMNNLASTLGLDGQRLTAQELVEKLRREFPNMVLKDVEESRRDTVFQFAPKDAIQFRIENGGLEMKIAFDSVELDGEAMENVTIHSEYSPAVAGLNADLVRNGSLGVEGELSAAERARLHNIFKQVFPPDQRLEFAHLNLDDHRLDGLMITQLVMEDGWVGIAIGPEASNRTAERFRSLR